MPEYVYAVHDFLPEHEDEVSFHAGERIEVIERDDMYGDGWWQGRNLAGKAGLFPQAYTTSAPPKVEAVPLATSTSTATNKSTDSDYTDATSTVGPSSPVNSAPSNGFDHGFGNSSGSNIMGVASGSTLLGPVDEESETESPPLIGSFPVPPIFINGHDTAIADGQPNGSSNTNGSSNLNGHQSISNDITNRSVDDSFGGASGGEGDGEMMKATMTDVQKAIEQLGRANHDPDHDTARSFSFASSRDRDTETETDTDFDTDADADASDMDSATGENWHKGARRKLAEKARRAVEEAEKLEAMMSGESSGRGEGRFVQPPIEVEMSDESEDEEEEEQRTRHTHHRVYSGDRGRPRDHPHISEASEEEDEGRREGVQSNYPKAASEETASARVAGSSGTRTADANHRSREELSVPARDEEELPTATASKTSFPSSVFQPSPLNDQKFGEQQNRSSAGSIPPVPISQPPASEGVLVGMDKGKSVDRSSVPAAIPLPLGIATGATVVGVVASAVASPRSNSPPSASTALSYFSSTAPSSTAPTSALQSSTIADGGKETVKDKKPAEEWTLEEVVDWLKSKGFDQTICDKFIEQEISGDVLLELDVNLLKTEIGIMAFGKRVRIANAITDLRRPPSIIYSDQHTTPSSPMYQSPSSNHANSPLNNYSPVNGVNHTRNESNTYSQGYPQSTQSDGYQSYGHPFSPPGLGNYHVGPLEGLPNTQSQQIGERRQSKALSDGSGVIVGIDEAMLGAAMVGLGIANEKGPKARPAQLTLSPSETALNPPAEAVSGPLTPHDEERGAVSEGEGAHSSQSIRRRIFGRSNDSSIKDKSRRDSASSRNSNPVSPLSSASPTTTRDMHSVSDGKEPPPGVTPRHSRGKRSIDASKSTDRMSLFGSIGGSLGKSRKPPPRYSTSITESEASTEKGSHSSRFFGGGKRSASRTASQSFPQELRDAAKEIPKEVSKPQERPQSAGKDRGRAARSPSPAVLRKRAGSQEVEAEGNGLEASPIPGAVASNPLKAGQSILAQIGEADHTGWMRKRGDRYNNWKSRYFVLKGPHMYCLRSNSKAETRIKGYIHVIGYRVVADENLDPGRYGFKIIHDNDKTHFFSSDEKIVIREWMKAIMKATIGRDYTRPVVSSCNIPTIPLVVAQAMNPAPRPPSPTARDATQKALRRENPHQLSSRDARVLMGLPSSSAESVNKSDRKLESVFKPTQGAITPQGHPISNGYMDQSTPSIPETPTPGNLGGAAPPRPSREMRNVSSVSERPGAIEDELIEWANSHIPTHLQMLDINSPLFNGLALLRLAESIKGRPSSPPVPDSAFPNDANDDKLDGLFRLFDFLLDNDVKMGSVSINDVRQGKREKIVQLLKALKTWEDKRRSVAQTVGSNGQNGAFAAPVGMAWT